MNPDKLIEGIAVEIESFESLYLDISRFPSMIYGSEINNYDKAAIALMLSQFFNGIENILKRILEQNSIKLPKNEQFHINLINAFSEKSNYDIGIIFSNEIIDGLSILRRFRHYVFHGYSFKLEWDRLSLAIESLPNIFDDFKEQILQYSESLK